MKSKLKHGQVLVFKRSTKGTGKSFHPTPRKRKRKTKPKLKTILEQKLACIKELSERRYFNSLSIPHNSTSGLSNTKSPVAPYLVYLFYKSAACRWLQRCCRDRNEWQYAWIRLACGRWQPPQWPAATSKG